MPRTEILLLAASFLLLGAAPDRDDKGDKRTWGVVRKEDRGRDAEKRDRGAKTGHRERKRERVSAWSTGAKPPGAGAKTWSRAETTPNRHYWHEENGVRYTHYYDGRKHWYGFRHDDRFYWTRLHRNRWWWYDSNRARWVYWNNGLWWWPGPGGAPYAYIGADYFPYQTVPPAPAAAPAAPAANAGFVSPDGKRQVQIAPDGAATLYDVSAGTPRYMATLAASAQRVTFGGGSAGEPLRILLELRSGGFCLFDGDGRELDIMTAAGKAAEPPADVPDSLPPIPTAAPGE